MVETTPLLIAGATGAMGQRIARQLIKRGAKPRLLLRGGERHERISELSDLIEAGALIVDGDVTDPSTLSAALDGIDTVVSTLQGGPDVIIDGQRNLAEAAKKAGASRIYPSDFSIDHRPLTVEEHLFLGWRKVADDAIAEIGLPQTNVFNGAFMEMLAQPFFGPIDWDARTVTYWINADQPFDMTTMDDTAAYVAEALTADEQPDGGFEIVGDAVSMRKIAEIAGEIAGRPFELKPLGDRAALEATIMDLQDAHPNDPTQWIGLQYMLAMASGKAKLHYPQNDRFPNLAATDAAAFLRHLKK